MLTVAATHIALKSVPSSAVVDENTEVTLTCTTDEANPTAHIVWKVGNDVITTSVTSTVNGEQHTQKRVSVLKLKATRSLHSVVFKCIVDGTNVQDEYTMEVQCEYLEMCLQIVS